MGIHSLLQGVFLTQGSNQGLPHCRKTLYCLSLQGSPYFSKQKLSLNPQNITGSFKPWSLSQEDRPGGQQLENGRSKGDAKSGLAGFEGWSFPFLQVGRKQQKRNLSS